MIEKVNILQHINLIVQLEHRILRVLACEPHIGTSFALDLFCVVLDLFCAS